MIQKWICEKCGEEFDNEQYCLQHERNCNPVVIHTCAKCGKQESWGINEDIYRYEQESWHPINLGKMGYGSGLDGCDVDFELCDNCLCEIIDTFKHKENIYNSGSNFYIDYDVCDIE